MEHIYSKNYLYFLTSSFSSPFCGAVSTFSPWLAAIFLYCSSREGLSGAGRCPSCGTGFPQCQLRRDHCEPRADRKSRKGSVVQIEDYQLPFQAVKSCPSVRAVPRERGQGLEEQEAPGEFGKAQSGLPLSKGSSSVPFFFFSLYRIHESLP